MTDQEIFTRNLILSTEFDRIYQQADKVTKMDSSLISYLRECDRRFNETRKTKKTK